MNFQMIGYYIVDPVIKPEYISLPCKTLLSISPCICDIHPNLNNCFWDKHDADRTAYKAQLGLSNGAFSKLLSTVAELFNSKLLDVDGRFISLADAHSFYNSYLSNRIDAKIIGVALLQDNVEKLIGEYWGLNAAAPRKTPEQKQLLGGEIIGFDGGSFHSYLCNGLEKDISKQYTIITNDCGTIQNDYSQIQQFADYIQGKGEPVLWLPCLLYNCGVSLI